jgi:hypothetical protein
MESFYGTYGTTTFPGIQTALAQALDESNEHDKPLMHLSYNMRFHWRFLIPGVKC